MSKKEIDTQQDDARKSADQSRRDFLRKSKYAAYATPFMTGLIIKSAAANCSGTGCSGDGGGGSVGFS